MIAVVAYNKNYAIAENGKIPWYVPEDFKHFKETTKGGTVIMGRVTYDTLPDRFRPLPDRYNIVITRNVKDDPNVTYTDDIKKSQEISQEHNPGEELYVIGGEQIYDMAFKEGLITKVIASEIEDNTVGDQFFRNLHEEGWESKVLKEYEDFRVLEFTP